MVDWKEENLSEGCNDLGKSKLHITLHNFLLIIIKFAFKNLKTVADSEWNMRNYLLYKCWVHCFQISL